MLLQNIIEFGACSRKIRWTRHAACLERKKNAYRLMASKTQAEKLLGISDVNYLEDREVGTVFKRILRKKDSRARK